MMFSDREFSGSGSELTELTELRFCIIIVELKLRTIIVEKLRLLCTYREPSGRPSGNFLVGVGVASVQVLITYNDE